MIEIIAFDADDTLWHNETLYNDTQERYRQLLAPYAGPEEVDRVLFETEMGNLPYFGYGIKSFILSMIEAAVKMTGGRVTAGELGQIVEFARDMLRAEIRLLDGVRDIIAALAEQHDLMLITKGDLLDQEAKLERSGLAGFFRYFEVVSDKTPERYAALMKRYHIRPETFLMVGNSLRSDILPVLELGGKAVYIPYEMTWAHEMVEAPGGQQPYIELKNITELPGLLQRIDQV